MRIAHVVSTFPPYRGGMGNVAREIAERTAASGHEVVVITPHDGDAGATFHGHPGGRGWNPAPTLRAVRPWLRFGNAAWCPGIRRTLEDVRPDVVHLHWPFIGGVAPVLAWRRDHSPIRTNRRMEPQPSVGQLIVQYHMDLMADGWRGVVFAAYERWVIPRMTRIADRVVVSSRDYARNGALAPSIEQLGERLVEIPLGVDTERFLLLPHPPSPPLPQGSGEIKKNFSPSRGEGEREGVGTFALFVGGLDRAHAFKGVPTLLEAIAQVPRTHLTIVGDGDLRSRYEEQAHALGISDRVEFLGSVPDSDLPNVYSQSDIFVLPSTARSEAFGVALLEAMACGKPTITSDLPGVRTVVADGETGFLVPPGHVPALVERIRTLQRDRGFATRMGVAGRRRVEGQYGWNHVIGMWDTCYRSL